MNDEMPYKRKLLITVLAARARSSVLRITANMYCTLSGARGCSQSGSSRGRCRVRSCALPPHPTKCIPRGELRGQKILIKAPLKKTHPLESDHVKPWLMTVTSEANTSSTFSTDVLFTCSDSI